MTVENSKNLLVKIGNGSSPETFTNIGTQANGALSLSANRIDTTNKTTENYASAIAGLRSFVITADGFADWPDTAGLAALITEAVAGNDFNAQIVLNSASLGYQASVQANQLEINGPVQQATQWATTWELSQGTPSALTP